ncbi:Formin-like protein 11 [Vitis vinifera]|uniref:Formin-like protein n=1 Tax=Vitis vinifera TaxID=29760 RepID=A0A438D833_VITVI|nr:Formin-like protein 11 [Vitis vinifera]
MWGLEETYTITLLRAANPMALKLVKLGFWGSGIVTKQKKMMRRRKKYSGLALKQKAGVSKKASKEKTSSEWILTVSAGRIYGGAHILIPAVSSAAVLNAEENYFNAVDGLKSLHFIEDNTTDGKEQMKRASKPEEPDIMVNLKIVPHPLLHHPRLKMRLKHGSGPCTASPCTFPSSHHPKQIPPAHRAHRESRENPGRDLQELSQSTAKRKEAEADQIMEQQASPTLLESEGLGHRQLRKSESGHVSYASGEGIVSVHGDAESGDDHSNGGGSSSGSFRDAAEVFSPNVYKIQPSLPSSSNLPIPPATPDLIPAPAPNIGKISHHHLHATATTTASQFSPSPSSFSTTQLSSKASCSYTLASPRNSDSSSGSNQTPQRDLQPPSHKPPNPPPPPGGIPPPPCPPPFLRVNSNSLKTPPPPPSQLSQFIPLGKDGAPLPKLKPLHWDKVRAAPNRSTVWDKLRSSSFELDEKMIESLFGYNLQTTMKNDEAKSKSPSPSKHVLEPKRLQNITILSKALNATAGQVCDALQQGDGLCLQQLEALAKMVPTDEEEAKLSSYNGDINELGSAERFVKAMLDIPFAFLRIEAMLYKETFEDEVVHLRKSFSMLEEACKELRSSRLFLKLLEAVLKTGNRMNVGTIRGGARAFKLDALLKLSDVKGTDGKTTLLHFVVQEMIRTEGIKASESIIGKINLKTKNKTVEERRRTATVDMDVLASSVSNLSDGKRKLQNLVNNDLGNDQRSRNFVGSMKSFLGHAEKNLKELQEDENRVLLQVREITEYFHGDVSKDEANPLRIFVIVRDFLGMLDHICKELRSAKIPRSPNPLSPFR